jgi:hypothetical protein
MELSKKPLRFNATKIGALNVQPIETTGIWRPEGDTTT